MFAMRCSHCDMPLSPTRTDCPRCGTAIATLSNGFKGQGALPSASMQAPSEYRQQQNTLLANNPDFVGASADVAPAQQDWNQHASNAQETPFAATIASPPIPSISAPEDSHVPNSPTFSSVPLLLKPNNLSASVGFGLAGLCTVVACLILIFVYFMAQNLPQPSPGVSPRVAGGLSSLAAQNTPVIDLSPTATASTASTASPTPTYPGQQYIANAKTASAVNVTNAQPTLPATNFKVGQKIYVTFDVHPNGHVGAICLLWFINGTPFTSYPFALNTTNTTSAYSYAATRSAGPGYIEIYWESAPSCTDLNKILSDHLDFTVTA